ncbi:MAG: hypothetical protein ACSLFQ_06715 [Thermoanaerobaculia bacterium]
MTTSTPRTDPLRPGFILLFWLPLAATWLMMAAEGPYIAAIVARMPDAAPNLAAYGVAFSLSWLIESPIMMLLSASNALVRDARSFIALRRFTFVLNCVVTGGMILVAIPPVFRFVGEGLIGLPREISELAHGATAILIPWPAAIGYRRFLQGIMTRHHLTRRVAYGTVVRLVVMSVTAVAVAKSASLPGAYIAAIALVTGVVAEAGACRWMARHVVKSIVESDEVAPEALVRFGEIARFYYPLALTSMLSMALGPIVTFGLGRGREPIESLAVWPVVAALLFLFRSGGLGYQEAGVALIGRDQQHCAEVTRIGLWLGLLFSAGIALVALTPLETLWFERVSGLTPELTAAAIWPARIMILLPALEYVMATQRARLILLHRTRLITVATAIEAGGLAVTLLLAVGPLGMVGAVAGAIATMVGRIAANAYLYVRLRSCTPRSSASAAS